MKEKKIAVRTVDEMKCSVVSSYVSVDANSATILGSVIQTQKNLTGNRRSSVQQSHKNKQNWI
jgi:hypothetical protein